MRARARRIGNRSSIPRRPVARARGIATFSASGTSSSFRVLRREPTQRQQQSPRTGDTFFTRGVVRKRQQRVVIDVGADWAVSLLEYRLLIDVALNEPTHHSLVRVFVSFAIRTRSVILRDR